MAEKFLNLKNIHKSIVLLILWLSVLSLGSIYTYSSCTSTQILNTKTLACEQCPANKQPNKLQLVPNECICKKGFYSTSNGLCAQYFTGSSSSCGSEQYINAFENDGSMKTVSACANCNSSAYQNGNGTGCIPCMTGMSFNSTNKKCQCTDASQVQTTQGCFPQSYSSVLGLTLSSSVYSGRLKYLVPGCYYFKSVLACSQLVNLCVYSLLGSTPECEFFKKANLTSYLYSQTANVFKLTTLSKDSQISMRLVYFLPDGNYVKQKDLKLSDIMQCGLPSSSDIPLLIGSNIEVSCDFNFNNLLAQIGGTNYKNYLYQLLMLGQNGLYYEVNAYLNSNSQPVKRFFLEDTFTSTTSINVLTSLKLEMTLTSENILVTPSLHLSYTKLSLEPGTGITPSSQQTQSISYNIQFTSQLSGFWSVILPIFIVINILIIIHAVLKTYIGYLNRKTPFLFFLNFIDIWSLWIFYFLLVTTGYWFIFTKTTPNIYTFISNSSSLYVAFYIVFGLMVAFRLISVTIEKAEKLKIQVFMINKEKDKALNNSWREIFIINSLAEFCTYRTFSVFWILLVMLFFVTGLKWEHHSRQVVTATLDQIQYFHKKNDILLYFLSTSILLVIALVFKILRRLTVLFWPYPFQDFVDYCTVTNISFFFMKKRSPEAYYIHACLPERTDVNFKELNNAVRRGLQKTRSLSNELNQRDRLKMYITYVNRDMEQKFAQMIKREQDQDHNRHTKYSIGSNVALKPLNSSSKNSYSFRQDFIQKRIKPMLEQIVQKDQQRTKSAFQSFFRIPPADLRNQRGLNETQVYMDDKMDLVKEVFPNGDQFEELHTIIIIYLLWVVVTGSSPIAAFLTYICDQWIFNAWIGSSYRKHLQKMTRVKEGFML